MSEATYFSRFDHPNIVRLCGIMVESPPIYGIALELCAGGMLSTLFRRVIDAAIPKRIIVDWAHQVRTSHTQD